MKLSEAIEKAKLGYSIRNRDHGFQMLIPQNEECTEFKLSASLGMNYIFTTVDHLREDWEVVGYSPSHLDAQTNPELEKEFGIDGKTPGFAEKIMNEDEKD